MLKLYVMRHAKSSWDHSNLDDHERPLSKRGKKNAKKICELFKKNPNKHIAFTKDRLYNDKRYSVSSTKIRTLGWKPQRSLLKDLPMMIEWYTKNYKMFNKV